MNRYRPLQTTSTSLNSNQSGQSRSPNSKLYILFLLIIAFSLMVFSPLHSLSLSNNSDLNIDHSITTKKDLESNYSNIINSNNQNNNNLRSKDEIKKKKKIAYAITVTKDGNFLDGALVLGHSARKIHSKRFKNPDDYDMDLVAFVTSSVKTSKEALEKFGWKVLVKGLPVELDEIKNEQYVEKMRNSGCCGADEFLKLWSYTLTDYEIVIHLDMDSIIFQTMDELVNINKEFLFTGDYNMMSGSPVPPAQGGFIVVKPSMKTFSKFQEIIREGDYGNHGWGNTGIGRFWGGQTIQGILPYYYYSIDPGNNQELDRCIYNNMVDNPYNPRTLKCLDGKETCKDCRISPVEEVKSAHFTICQKPWSCTEFTNPKNMVVCKEFHKKWFQLRDEFEREVGVPLLRPDHENYLNLKIPLKVDSNINQIEILDDHEKDYRADNSRNPYSYGMCKGYGDKAYIPIPVHSIEKINENYGK